MKLYIPAFFLCLLILTGCSGGRGKSASPSTAERSMVFAVNWPDRSRLIPRAAESVQVMVYRDGNTVASAILNRPANGGSTRVTLPRLPVGRLVATATAYPASNASGTAQATGTAQVNAQPGQPFSLTVEMDSTIDSIGITADRSSVFLGDSLQLTATAKDRNGNIVLTGDTIRWHVSDSYAEVDSQSGRLVGRSQGTTTITVKETESGIEETTYVKVKGVSSIHVEPSAIRILDDEDAYLTAIAYDSEGAIAPLTDAGWYWDLSSSSVALLFGTGSVVRVGGLSVGQTELTVQTTAGGYASVPVYVYPSTVSGTMTVSRSGYSGPSNVYVSGDGMSATLSGGDTYDVISLGDFLVDDSRMVLVELDDLTEEFTDDDSVSFTLDLSGPNAPNGYPYFIFADSGGTSVSGTLTRSQTSLVYRLVVRDPISGDARSRKSRRPGGR